MPTTSGCSRSRWRACARCVRGRQTGRGGGARRGQGGIAGPRSPSTIPPACLPIHACRPVQMKAKKKVLTAAHWKKVMTVDKARSRWGGGRQGGTARDPGPGQELGVGIPASTAPHSPAAPAREGSTRQADAFTSACSSGCCSRELACLPAPHRPARPRTASRAGGMAGEARAVAQGGGHRQGGADALRRGHDELLPALGPVGWRECAGSVPVPGGRASLPHQAKPILISVRAFGIHAHCSARN